MSLQLVGPASYLMNRSSIPTNFVSQNTPTLRCDPRGWRAERIIGQSPAIRRVLEQVRKVASTDSTVLLLGETGSGKELFATEVHRLSARRAQAMVRVNCAAIPGT